MIAPEFVDILGGREREKPAFEQFSTQREAAEKDPAAVSKLAKVIRDDAFSMYMFGAFGNTPLAGTPLESYRKFVDDYVRDVCGDDCCRSPLLRMLVEQALLAHHTIARLHYEAAGVLDPEFRRVNHALATNLTGELRRLIGQITPMVEEYHKANSTQPKQNIEPLKKAVLKTKLASKQSA